MSKVIDETWEASGADIRKADGRTVATFTGNEYRSTLAAQARLAAQAPTMALLLLSLRMRCPFCEPDVRAALRNEHEADCPLMTTLSAAGVLP